MKSDTFANQLATLTSRLESKLNSLISNPTSDNIHDIRTTIRRIEATFDLLPKNLRRKRRADTFLRKMKKLFKATSQIRDIDIIEAKMRQFDSAPALPEFLARQTDKRKQLLVTEAKAAKTLKQTAVPRFKTRQISDTKLSKRTKKVTKRLENRFKGHLSIALNKPTPDQLHDFRKTCKMLRYTFEIEKEANERVLGPLQELQKLLGGILDNYTTLRSISESSFKNSAALILDKLNLETEEMRHSLRIILEKMEGSTVKKSGMVEISQARRMERDLSSNLGVAPTAKESRH